MSKGLALVITAKYPEPGAVKTALARRLGFGLATELHRAFLLDLDARLTCAFPAVYWAYPPESPLFPELLGPQRRYLIQQGEEQGERAFELLRTLLLQGHDRVVMVGPDLPHLAPGIVEDAFEKLTHCDLVLGPSADGGYYLIGVRDTYDLFSYVSWNTDLVLAQTLVKAAEQGLTVGFLPESFGIDKPEDVEKLEGLLAEKTARALLPFTSRALSGRHPAGAKLGSSRVGRFYRLAPAQVEEEEQACKKVVGLEKLAKGRIARHLEMVSRVASVLVERMREDLSIPISDIAVSAARYHDACRCDDRSRRLRPYRAEPKGFFFPHDGHETLMAFALRRTKARTIARIIRKHCVLRIAYPEERTIDENILLIADSMVEAEEIVPVAVRRDATIGRYASENPSAREAYETAYDMVERTLEMYFDAGLDKRQLLSELGLLVYPLSSRRL